MKKIVTLALMLSMLALLVVPSFADSTEEEKIIEAAQKGVVLASLLYRQQLFFDIYYTVDIEEQDAEIYNFMQGLVKYHKDDHIQLKAYIPTENEMYIEGDNVGCLYAPTGELINSRKDLQSLVKKYLADFSLTIDDESTVELIDGKYKAHHPVLRTIDGELKINFYNGDLNILEPSRYYFDEYEVISVDGNKAILKSPQYISEEQKTIDLTVELEKVNGQWKVCGGTIFTERHGSFNKSDLFAPRTGEDFSLYTHTLVIGVCAMLMLVLSKRKRTVA